jgi:hypothetical protein
MNSHTQICFGLVQLTELVSRQQYELVFISACAWILAESAFPGNTFLSNFLEEIPVKKSTIRI